MEQLGILEGILFVMGDEGCDLKTLSEIMEISEDEVKNLLKKLKKIQKNGQLLDHLR